MSEHYENIKIENEYGISLVTLNKPEIRNALIPGLKSELCDFFEKSRMDSSIKVIILTGAGSSFCAGGNLKSQTNANVIDMRTRVKEIQQLIQVILNVEKPIIAAVNGAAAGAGFSLALACDLIIASKSSSFIQSFTKVGLIPDLGSAYFLPQLVGPYLAKKMMFLSESIPAEKAYELQFVNEVVEDDLLLEKAFEIGRRLVEGPAISIGLTKNLINKVLNNNLQEFLDLEASYQALCSETDDFKEGVASFFEKRKPLFTGK
ncbi:enoyl-CoA hydratase/isomerase family protein [Bacillus sp. JJ722]|uniref:enoyl-CoA hydratase/isomerase family protein n=1 Tax=Bacillus sp. JJ722 TaxID=3122973 RepID=UPI002FFF52BC